MQGRVQQHDERAHAVTEHAHFAGTRINEHTPYRSRHVLCPIVVELHLRVFGTNLTPIEQVNIETLFEHELDKTETWPHVEQEGAVDRRKDEQEWHRVAFGGRSNRLVAVEGGLVQPPHFFARGLAYGVPE